MNDTSHDAATRDVDRTAGRVPLVAETVTAALRTVIDPEVGLDIVTLGLIYDVAIDDDVVAITYTLTTPGCPLAAYMDHALRQAVAPLCDGRTLDARVVFHPPWTPDRIEGGAW